MEKPFEVKAVKKGRIHAISFSLDSTRPENYYACLEQALAQLNVDGRVLLDLLACNGETSRRFVTVNFDGERLAFDTLRVEKMSSLEPEVLNVCSAFYATRHRELVGSVLSTPARGKLGSSAH